MTKGEFDAWLASPTRRVLVMGVLNVTPDSFSDGNRFFDAGRAAAHARAMTAAGADMIDIGGESTRPGSERVEAGEQVRRILPVLKALGGETGVVLSVDTTRAEVARAALDHGAYVINDISAGRDDPTMLRVAAATGSPLVLMHMQGEPRTMQLSPCYVDVVGEVGRFLAERMEAAGAAGVGRERILLDPGIGFGKTVEHNLTLLRELRSLTSLGRPLVLGTSRKGFIGRISGEAEPGERLFGTAASVAWCVANGAAVVRVHDVAAMSKVVRVIEAIRGAAAAAAAEAGGA